MQSKSAFDFKKKRLNAKSRRTPPNFGLSLFVWLEMFKKNKNRLRISEKSLVQNPAELRRTSALVFILGLKFSNPAELNPKIQKICVQKLPRTNKIDQNHTKTTSLEFHMSSKLSDLGRICLLRTKMVAFSFD
jgi:hypothetical protein